MTTEVTSNPLNVSAFNRLLWKYTIRGIMRRRIRIVGLRFSLCTLPDNFS